MMVKGDAETKVVKSVVINAFSYLVVVMLALIGVLGITEAISGGIGLYMLLVAISVAIAAFGLDWGFVVVRTKKSIEEKGICLEFAFQKRLYMTTFLVGWLLFVVFMACYCALAGVLSILLLPIALGIVIIVIFCYSYDSVKELRNPDEGFLEASTVKEEDSSSQE